MTILGPVTRAALQDFERDDLVEDVQIHHDRVRVLFTTGVAETWGLEGEKPKRLTLPTGGWTKHRPAEAPEYGSFRQLDFDYRPEEDPFFFIAGRDVRRAGFLEQRLVVHRVVDRLLREGWVKPRFPGEALAYDLARLQADARKFVVVVRCATDKRLV